MSEEGKVTAFSRRDFAQFGIATFVALGAARGGMAIGQGPSGDELIGHIDPELVPAARQIMQISGQNEEWDDARLVTMRKGGEPSSPARLPDVPVEELKVRVGEGQPDVTVYVINARTGSRRPGILHTHGGGYILGSARSEVSYEQALARELDCIIVTVEYRLAPETTYLGSVEDNYAALRWMHGQAERLGLDRKRIAVMGESAGGGHAARLAITARDRREMSLAAQILVYPMLDDRTGSTIQPPPFIGAFGWTAPANRYGWRAFLGQTPGGPNVPPAAVPARVRDLSGLPPAFIGVGGIDLFVDEDIDYARRLTQAGVSTELLLVPGAFHGFDRVAPEASVSKAFTRAKLNALRKAFGQPIV